MRYKVRGRWSLGICGTKSNWWFQIVCIFTPIWGNDSHFDDHIFQRGWDSTTN